MVQHKRRGGWRPAGRGKSNPEYGRPPVIDRRGRGDRGEGTCHSSPGPGSPYGGLSDCPGPSLLRDRPQKSGQTAAYCAGPPRATRQTATAKYRLFHIGKVKRRNISTLLHMDSPDIGRVQHNNELASTVPISSLFHTSGGLLQVLQSINECRWLAR